jgi:hypothetical protein
MVHGPRAIAAPTARTDRNLHKLKEELEICTPDLQKIGWQSTAGGRGSAWRRRPWTPSSWVRSWDFSSTWNPGSSSSEAEDKRTGKGRQKRAINNYRLGERDVAPAESTGCIWARISHGPQRSVVAGVCLLVQHRSQNSFRPRSDLRSDPLLPERKVETRASRNNGVPYHTTDETGGGSRQGRSHRASVSERKLRVVTSSLLSFFFPWNDYLVLFFKKVCSEKFSLRNHLKSNSTGIT